MLIIFDLDDTLIDTHGSILPHKLESSLRLMVAKGLEISDMVSALEMLLRFNAAAESSKDALQEFLEIHDADPQYLHIGCEEIYQKKEFHAEIKTTTGAFQALSELAKKHVLSIVSFGVPEIQMEKLKKAGMDTSLFSRIVICESPDKRQSYQALSEDLGFFSDQVLVCGDRIKRDLAPAKKLGFRTVHMRWGRGLYQPSGEETVDYTITSLGELKPILAHLEEP